MANHLKYIFILKQTYCGIERKAEATSKTFHNSHFKQYPDTSRAQGHFHVQLVMSTSVGHLRDYWIGPIGGKKQHVDL